MQVYRLLDCRTGFQKVVSAGSQLQRRLHRRKRYRVKTRLLCCSGHRIEAAILLVRGDTREKCLLSRFSLARKDPSLDHCTYAAHSPGVRVLVFVFFFCFFSFLGQKSSRGSWLRKFAEAVRNNFQQTSFEDLVLDI
ncbi:uncharacterized protein LOC9645257 isoform X2 [Selaginella moellendorffii]|uniref:uncharacterized protein LOC9645257 isoform X2 n=1 Tax=Selaginella moellendorffii TaxID=88036 RepID=UPI000D1CC27D|nr:uncharacterized protein LOC9645257 isoform X2 [Selaginella moellendorffii]|eukprot:XP_024536339.1 uncharacterized protein LOC9645257 isoform X2 [Selaginella moellendorffii]